MTTRHPKTRTDYRLQVLGNLPVALVLAFVTALLWGSWWVLLPAFGLLLVVPPAVYYGWRWARSAP